MHADLHAWLINAGYPVSITLTPISGNMGSTSMWKLDSPDHRAPLVVRLFGKIGDAAAEREASAMQAAAGNGVPVPEIHGRGEFQGRPLLVTSFIEGRPAAGHVLQASPAVAHAFGVQAGETLGRINQVTAPEHLGRSPDDWLGWGGDALVPIRPLLAAIPIRDRLVHFDFHLLNIMVHHGTITGVIDWENAAAAPPHMDLARSLAVIRAIAVGNRYPDVDPETIASFERGLIEGHTRIVGPDPHPELSRAWGLTMTTYDLANHIGKPNAPLSEEAIGVLAAERDLAIERALSVT